MATHDYDIANQSGAAFRTDLNNALAAIQSNNSNSSSPSNTVAYQWWADTTNNVLKIRNSSNNDWVELLQLDGTLTLEDGSASTPGLAFRDDLNTGIFSSAADTFNVATGGVERMELGSATIFNDSGADVDFRIEGDTDENLFRVDASTNRIGIGTGTPSNLLHVAGVLECNNIKILGTNSFESSANILEGKGSKGARLRSALSAADTPSFSSKDDTDTGFFLPGSDVIGFTTGGSERARITSGGALLINKSTDRTAYYGGTFSGLLQIEGTGNLSRLTQFIHNQAGQNQHIMVIGKSRGSSVGSYTVVQDDDYLGTLSFQGADGDEMVEGARIDVRVDGTPANSNMPAKMTFGINAGAGSTTERMRIIPTGFVGIGQGSSYDPGAPLEVRNPAGTTPSTGNFVLLRLCAQHNSSRGLDIGTGRPTSGNQNDAGVFYNARDTESSGYSAQHVFQRAGNNVMVIGYQGNNNVGIGTDTPDRQLDVVKGGTKISRFQQTTNNTGEDHTCITLRHAAAISGQNGVGMIFQNSGGTVVGKIDFGQSTTQYRTSSDYRLKENAVAISDGITRLKTLKPYRFNFIAEPDKTVDGFFAHEVTAVPEAISGTKDEVETTYYQSEDDIPEGKAVGDVKSTTSPVYQGIDHSKLVPLLVAAVQELITKVETLEAA